MFFKFVQQHPIDNTSNFKALIFKSTIMEILLGFIFIYLFIGFIFSLIYINIIGYHPNVIKEIIQFSLLTSFSFDADIKYSNQDFFYFFNLIHQVCALVISTIFTATIVLKFFYLPKFFVFKKKCNYVNNILTISFYNSIDLFVTDCKIRIYGRVETKDQNGVKSLQNINGSEPIFEKTFPFMERYLVTRLNLKLQKEDFLYKFFQETKKDEKFTLIIILEAKASRLDQVVYEIFQYKLDSKNLQNTVDFHQYHSIDLDFNNYKNSKGWENFEQ